LLQISRVLPQSLLELCATSDLLLRLAVKAGVVDRERGSLSEIAGERQIVRTIAPPRLCRDERERPEGPAPREQRHRQRRPDPHLPELLGVLSLDQCLTKGGTAVVGMNDSLAGVQHLGHRKQSTGSVGSARLLSLPHFGPGEGALANSQTLRQAIARHDV